MSIRQLPLETSDSDVRHLLSSIHRSLRIRTVRFAQGSTQRSSSRYQPTSRTVHVTFHDHPELMDLLQMVVTKINGHKYGGFILQTSLSDYLGREVELSNTKREEKREFVLQDEEFPTIGGK